MSSKNKAIQAVEVGYLRHDLPSFAPGDTVIVDYKIKEGNKERVQAYEGVVIAIRKNGVGSTFKVRRVSHGVATERLFMMHSPLIDSIKVARKGLVRRAKLYYLRERFGKAARIQEKLKKATSV